MNPPAKSHSKCHYCVFPSFPIEWANSILKASVSLDWEQIRPYTGKYDLMIRVFIIDDHPTVRLGLSTALKAFGLKIVGECGTAKDLLESRKLWSEIDVLLLDVELPLQSGLDALEEFRSKGFPGKIVIFTHHTNPEVVDRVIESGGNGYLSKQESPETISILLQSVMQGRLAISPIVQTEILGKKKHNPMELLTPRETEVLKLLVHGLKHKEISDRLNITPRTVDFHRQNLKEKLDAESLVDLVRIADRYGV